LASNGLTRKQNASAYNISGLQQESRLCFCPILVLQRHLPVSGKSGVIRVGVAAIGAAAPTAHPYNDAQ
jgi:hypothetical protein